jgi:hypothetical protein
MNLLVLRLAVLASALVACNSKQITAPPTPMPNEFYAEVSSGPVKHPTTLAHTLIQRYHVLYEHDGAGQRQLIPFFGKVKYQPRQSTFNNYLGWDVLNVPRADVARSERSDWLNFTLNRPAKVVVLWHQSTPWLSTWQANNDSDGYKVFSKDFAAGEHKLPSPGIDVEPYTLLLAEENGQPSSTPALPAQAPVGAVVPMPNSRCPSWLHEMYSVQGPDGQLYDSWHPQIDPVYWCYFGHEHGSDPGLIGYSGVALGYVAKLNFNQNEVHHGFKGFVIRDDATNIGWYFSVHAETGFENRVCVQFHTVVVAAVGLANTSNFAKGELLVELSLKGDFGASIVNKLFANKEYVIKKTSNAGAACADQEAIYNAGILANSKAIKKIRVAADPFGNDGYEVWGGGLQRALGFSFPDWSSGLVIDIENPTTTCDTITCNTMVRGNERGDLRALTLNYMRLTYKPELDTTDASPADGVFYSDLYATQFYGVDGSNRIHQYVKPNLDIPLPQGEFRSADAWRGLYVFEGFSIPLGIEDSLDETN